MKKVRHSIKTTLTRAFISLALFGLSTSTNAQWTITSVIGYNILSLTASGNNVYAGTDGNGVYLSTDQGASWTSIRNGFPQYSTPSVNCVAVSGNNLFAGTMGLGVYYSSNNGTSWTAVDNGVMAVNATVNSIAISGSNVFAGDDDGVYMTSDNGASWTLLTGSWAPSSLVISGSNIFAGVGEGSVYLSTNNGATWAGVNTGLPPNSADPISLAINGSDLYMATSYNYKGIFFSGNNGTSWAPADTGRMPYNRAYSIAISGKTIFAGGYGGVYYSNDNGTKWAVIDSGVLPYNGAVTALAVNGKYLVAGVSGNVEAGVWIYNVSKLLGVNEIASVENTVNIYPNPTNNQINVDLTNVSGSLQKIAIYDMNGRLLSAQNYSGGVRNSLEIIDISSFSNGIYLIQATTSTGTFYQKVCKN